MDIDWNQKRPNKKNLRKIYKKLSNDDFFKSVKPRNDVNLTTFKNIININNRHGSVKVMSFKFKEDKKIDWFLSRNRESEINFFEYFFKSSIFKSVSDSFIVKKDSC